jgi:hypothetical protein
MSRDKLRKTCDPPHTGRNLFLARGLLCVCDCEARAGRQGGELVDRIAARAPVGKLFLIKALGHTRVPFARYRPDHRAGIELATIDPYRAAEAAADLECRLDDGIARKARRDRLEIFSRRAIAYPPRWAGTVILNSLCRMIPWARRPCEAVRPAKCCRTRSATCSRQSRQSRRGAAERLAILAANRSAAIEFRCGAPR